MAASRLLRLSLVALSASLLRCGGENADHEVPFTCNVTAPTTCPDPALRYADIVPIMEKRCTSCHSGAVDGPWPLTDYEHVADWWDAIRAELLTCSMPPRDSDTSMTGEERIAVLTWIRCGFPP